MSKQIYELGDINFTDITVGLKVGNVLAIYTDDGPKGICGQSMSVTCPHESIHWFLDYDTFKEAMKDKNISRMGKRAQWRYVVLGEGAGVMNLVLHHKE